MSKQIKTACEGAALVPIGELEIMQGDLKSLSKGGYQKLKTAIERHGFTAPIFVWRGKNKILDGTQRLRTVKQMLTEGYEVNGGKLPVCWIEAENLKEAKAILLDFVSQYGKIEDQGLYEFLMTGEPLDFEEMKLEIDLPEIDLADFEQEYFESEPPEEPPVPEPPKNPICKTGELWLLDKHRLLCGDATKKEDVERLMDGKKAELCFTSPPYSDMRDYGGNDLSVETLAQFVSLFYPYAAYMVINLGIKRETNQIIEYWQQYIKNAQDAGYMFLSWNVWDRLEAGGIGNQTAIFEQDHEWLLVFGKKTKQLNRTVAHSPITRERYSYGASTRRLKNGTLQAIDLTKTHTLKQLSSVSRIRLLKARNIDNTHPAMFPVELPLEYIEALTQQDNIIIDSFLGSGTTLIACENLNRICYGTEISPAYCDVILNRWAGYTGKDPVREDGVKWSALQEIPSAAPKI